ncbi:hypothetical protein UCH007_13340 [Dehalococcoides sp. UCH007]|nr:hypothetical protein UCH007_13340 [Dehalococcoides sp. UCH007]
MNMANPEYGNVFPTRVGVNRNHSISPVALGVFPTRVGVNRNILPHLTITNSIPHACGGEPTA